VFSTRLKYYDIQLKSRWSVSKPVNNLDPVNLLSGYCSPLVQWDFTDAIKAQSSNICDMLCAKSHVYVDKVAKCHIYMSPRLLKSMYVSSSVVGSMVVQSARIACFRGNSILFPSAGGPKYFQT